MVSNDPAAIDRYCAGYEAATRTGRHAGATSTPNNPYRPGTEAFADWFEGFGDALRLQLDEIRAGRLVCANNGGSENG